MCTKLLSIVLIFLQKVQGNSLLNWTLEKAHMKVNEPNKGNLF